MGEKNKRGVEDIQGHRTTLCYILMMDMWQCTFVQTSIVHNTGREAWCKLWIWGDGDNVTVGSLRVTKALLWWQVTMREAGIWEIIVLSAQFCSEPTIALKIESSKKNRHKYPYHSTLPPLLSRASLAD